MRGTFKIDRKTKKIILEFSPDRPPTPGELVKLAAWLKEAELVAEVCSRITHKQRAKIFAHFNDMARHFGDDYLFYKDYLKALFCIERDREEFSLANCSRELAVEFMNYIIGWAIKEGVPLRESPHDWEDRDIAAFVYRCLEEHRCAVCGRGPEEIVLDLHHWDQRGTNGYKTDDHLRKMPLCREHHTLIHNIGRESFKNRYHLEGVLYPTAKWEAWKKGG